MTGGQKRIAGFLLLILAIMGFRPISTSAQTLTNDDPIQRAIELAAKSGYYDYRLFVEQTTYPAPRVANAGRTPKVEQLGLSGSADANADLIEMTIWQDGSFDPDTGVEMQLRDGRSYARRGPNAEWEEISNISDSVAPDGDPMVWFQAMTNVEQQETQTFPFDMGGGMTLTRYTFDVDGQAFGRYMGDLFYQRAALETPLPRGMRSQIPESYRNLTGTGELWVDADGLPSRMVLDLDYGEQKNGERVSAEMRIDFSNFNRDNLISVPFFGNPQQWIAVNTTAIVNTAHQTAIVSAALALFLLTILFVLRYHSRRSFYIGYVSMLIFSMVFLPVIDGVIAHAYMEHRAQRQVEHDARVADAERLARQREVVYGDTEEADSVSSIPYSAGETRNTVSTGGIDTDGDGLSDDDEAIWGTCAFIGAASNCDDVDDPTDSDGDGLSDGAEVNEYDTDPALADSDSDGIFDGLEVLTFTYENVDYQLDPNDSDKNNDGLIDGEECSVWVDGSNDYDAAAICPDTDGDSVPDPFDDDNDGDLVKDLADISPNSTISETLSNDNPLELSIDNLTVDQPVIVQIDFRPITDEHLTFSGHVLDWPSGDDEGQIQRQLDTTFATTENVDAQSTDDNAANGDMRLIPMIEVQMPYSDGHYSNLPITGTASAERTPGQSVDDWIDTTELDGYGISVVDADVESGLLTTYLPLNSVSDDNSDTVQAFTAVMYYQPSQGTNGVVDWGAAHQFRLVWFVQMLTDACIDESEDEDTCERQDVIDIVHVYHDEWQVTGLSISEEHGLETAVLYDAPTADSSGLPSGLTGVAWNLASTFLEGYDCDLSDGATCTSDGVRDIALEDLDATIDVWTGGDDNFVSTYQTGIHRDQASTLFSADTESILEDVFTNYADEIDPSLLYLQEINYRAQTLSNVSNLENRALTIDFDGVSDLVSVSMKLATYTYDDGWDEYDSQDYITFLQWQLAQDDDYFTLAGSDSEEELEGKLIWVRLFYTALYNGMSNTVEVDGEALYIYTDENLLAVSYDVMDAYLGTGLAMSAILTLINDLIASPALYAGDLTAFAQTGLAQSGGPGSPYPSILKTLQRSNILGNFVIVFIGTLLVLGIVLYAAGLVMNNDLALFAGEVVLQFANTVMLIQFASRIMTMVNIAKSVGTGSLPAASILQTLQFKLAIVGILVVIITLLFVVVLLTIYLVKYAGQNSYEADIALAYTIATIIVLFLNMIATILAIVLAVVASTGIGTVLLAIFAVVELFLTLFGVETATERLTNWLVDSLYDTDFIIDNLSSADRLAINIEDLAYGDDDLGLTTANTLSMTVSVTNTIEVESDNTLSEARDATFAYDLSTGSTNIHGDLELGDIDDEWTTINSDSLQIKSTVTLSDPISLEQVGSGINRSLDGYIYLIEGYEIPFYGCWTAVVYNDCTLYSLDGSTPINLGGSMMYDILPATLVEFVAFTPSGSTETRAGSVGWNANGAISFPEQQDQDNDGLLSIEQGGTDPVDSSADSDGDFLTDYFEIIESGTDPEDADSDNDGLTDYEETIYYTDPNDADSDDDGLTDYTEVIEGWLVSVTATDGSATTMRVWSDPWSADADEDLLEDLQEYIFGFHPNIETDPSIIENLIQINSMTVDEADQAVLWLEMEENSGVSVFSDSSGERNTAFCADTCPSPQADGVYGNGLRFDGTDDYLTAPAPFDPGTTPFTIAMWFYADDPGGSEQQLIHQQDGDGIGRIWLGLNANTLRSWWQGYEFAIGTVTAQQWHHAAVTYDGTTLVGYIDGEPLVSEERVVESSDGDLIIGKRKNTDSQYFAGLMDDVLMYERALSADEIKDIMNGRINANDLYVVPGQELTYSASVTNASGTNNAYGHLIGTSGYAEPEIAAPELALGFEPTEWLVSFANDTGDSIAPTCIETISCPAWGVEGGINNAIEFSDASQQLDLPTIGVTTEAVLAFWLYVTDLPASGEVAGVLATDRDGNALNVTLNDSGNLLLSLDGGTTNVLTSDYSFGGNLNTWVHVGYDIQDTYIKLFIDGTQNGDLVNHSTGEFEIGPGALGNSVDGTQPFSGRFDELFYQAEKRNEEEDFTRIMNGSYSANYEGAGQPEIYREVLFRFDESADLTVGDYFENTDSAECWNNGSCPTVTADSMSGYALLFDGINDQINLSDGNQSENFTIELSFYLHDLPDAGEEDYLVYSYHESEGLHIKVDSSGHIIADAIDVGVHTGIGQVSTYQWHTVRVEYAQTRNSGTYYYTSDIYIDDALDSSVEWYSGSSDPGYKVHWGSGRIGIGVENGSQTGAIAGIIDDITSTVYDITFDVETPVTTMVRNLVDKTTQWMCTTPGSCPVPDESGAHGAGIAIAENDAVTLDQTFHLQSDYTFAMWMKTDSFALQEVFHLSEVDTGDPVVRFFMDSGFPTFYHYFADNGSVANRTSDERMSGGEWRHYALVLDGSELSLYVDGELQPSTSSSVAPRNGTEVQLTLGEEGAGSGEDPFTGSIDELIYIPEATSADGVQVLMNSTWPAVEIADPFVTFSAEPNANIIVSGSATVSADVLDGLYTIEEEVEAALALQNETIAIPIVDTYSGDIDIFLPFEEVPGATVFQNIGTDADYVCADTGCPTAGLRGVIDRAAYFDGVDDGLVIQSTRSMSLRTRARDDDSISYSLWVKGESGTLFDTDDKAYEGIEADFNQANLHVDSGTTSQVRTSTLDYTIPQNIWTHVVFTFEDDNDPDQFEEDGIAKVFINGVLVDETTYYRDSNSTLNEGGDLAIGRTHRHTDFFKGYIDDFRRYDDIILTNDEILALYQSSAPVMRFEFDEESDESSYIDSIGGLVGYPDEIETTVEGESVTVLSPVTGTDGQIGNVALFDGTGVINVPDSESTVSFLESFTIVTWIQTEEAGVGLLYKGDGDSNWERGEKQFYLDDSGTPTFVGWGNRYIRSELTVNDGLWHHVAMVWDAEAATGHVYVDGEDVTNASSNYVANNAANSGDAMALGMHNNGEVNEVFTGKLDEMVIYQRALTGEEAASHYLREVRWYRDHGRSNVRVDTDRPTIELLSSADYFADGYVQLVVNTNDASSSVRLLEIGLKSHGDSDYTWWTAPDCLDSNTATDVWCPYFTTSGEGAYEVQFRAVDVVGNETTSGVYTFDVDATAPTVGSSFSATELDAIADESSDGLSWTLPLSGTVSDSGSGVYADSVAITLVDGRGEMLGGGRQNATVSGDTWTIDYEISGIRPIGELSLIVSAEDNVGNAVEETVGTILLDERAPSVALNDRAMTNVFSDSVTISGTVSELPNWYGNVLSLRFEDDLRDSSGAMNDAGCTNCPAYSDGLFGRSADFAADSVISAEIDNITDTLTIAGWLYMRDTGDTNIIDLGNGKATLAMSGDQSLQAQLTTASGTYTLTSSAGVLSGETWHHIALTWDGATLTAYLNGVAFGSQMTEGALIDGTTITIGDATQTVLFGLDEVQVYKTALTVNQLFALATSNVSGVSMVEVWLEQVFSGGRQSTSWQTATLDAAGERFANWSAEFSDVGDGFYQLNVRGTDANDNDAGDFVAWRGVVDTVSPTISSLSGVHIGGGTASQTEYSFTLTDFMLDEASVVHPCGENELVALTYDAPTAPNDGLTYQLSATCQVAGWQDSADVTVCDIVGHCATATITPTASVAVDSVAILSPTNRAVVSDTVVTLSGGAYDTDGIAAIEIRVNDTVIDTIVPDQSRTPTIVTDVTWSTEWSPSEKGDYIITVILTDTQGNETSDESVVTWDGEIVPTAVSLTYVGVVDSAKAVPFASLILILFLLMAGVTVQSCRLYKKLSHP